MDRVVLTSENSAAFYAGKLGIEPEPAVAETVKAEPEPVVESAQPVTAQPAAEDTEQPPESPDEPKSKVHVRFSELTEQRKAAEARAEKAEAEAKSEREARVLAEQARQELEQKLNPPKAEPDPEPQRAQFINDAEYLAARDEWVVDKHEAERQQKEAAEAITKAWTEREAKARAKIPTYDADVAKGANLMISNEVRDAIVDSDVGPEIRHYLATNPDFVAKLAAMKQGPALKQIGKLEAKFEAQPAPVDAKAAAVSETSRAPAPITPLKGANSVPEVPITADGEFHGTAAQWKALRKAGKIK
jgi:hypothetical protein